MISLHKEIKKVFDPNGILNPGKFLINIKLYNSIFV